VLDFLQSEKNKGRSLILATAAHSTIAIAVASHLKLFDSVIASDVNTNMKGITKRDVLNQKFGIYDYIGDSKADLPILQAAKTAYLVATSRSLQTLLQYPPEQIFTVPKSGWLIWIKALRPHQWVKNLLIFLPLLLSHQLFNLAKFEDALLTFVAFCCVASSGYIINDLLDLSADRVHPSKKNRPFASGQIPIQYGLPLFVLLVSLGFLVSLLGLSTDITGMLTIYLLLTLSYSFYFKQKVIVDVLILAGVYTHRILTGCIVVTVPFSSWLLAFSMFIFMSLAFLKRYTELLQLIDQNRIKNRSYEIGDIEMIASMGPTSGYLAVLVFALYINSEVITILYSSPFILWLICPLLLYWITRVWFLAHRKQMLDDPVQFALTDNISWFIMSWVIIFTLLAKFF